MSGWNPPPGPPGPSGPGGPPYGSGPPPGPGPGGPGPGAPPPYLPQQPTGPQGPYPGPPKPKSNAGLIVGLISGMVVLLLVLGVVAYLIGSEDEKTATPTVSSTTTSVATGTPTSNAQLTLVQDPPSAGGWPRDTVAERQLETEFGRYRTIMTNAAGKNLDNLVTAFFKDPAGTPLGTRPAGMIYIGGESPSVDPDAFVSGIKRGAQNNNATASSNVTVEDADPGTLGGKAVCETISTGGISLSPCFWATQRTIGMIIPSVPGRTVTQVGDLMRKMRPDLEKPR